MRRFWAFAVMVASLLIMVIFNVQSVYQSVNLSLEYEGGTEAVVQVTQRDGGDALTYSDISSKIMSRLDIAGARDADVEVVGPEDGSAQVRISLSTASSTAFDNIMRVVEGNGPISFSTANDGDVVKGTDLFDTRDPMALKYSGVTPIPVFQIGNTSLWDDLTADAKKATDTKLQSTIYVWQNKTDDDTYKTAFGTDKRDDVAKKVIATLDTSNYSTDSDGGYISVSSDENGNAFTIASARSYVNARNADDYGFDIEYLYENAISASYPASSLMLTMIGSAIGLGLLFLAFCLAFGLAGGVADLAIAIGTLFQLMIADFLGFEFTPVTIAAVLLSIVLGSFITGNYFHRVKEELRRGKSPERANGDGYRKSFAVTVQSMALVFFLALFAFLFGKGMAKAFAGVLLIGSLTGFLIVNYLTKWLAYWIATSPSISKRSFAFGLAERRHEPRCACAGLKKLGSIEPKNSRGRNLLTISLSFAIGLLLLGTFLGYGLGGGASALFSGSGDYAPINRVDITYVTERSISDENTFVDIDGFEANICDEQGLIARDNIESITFNRLKTMDEQYIDTYTTYISLKLDTALTQAQYDSLREYMLGGTSLNMVPAAYESETVVTSSVSRSGAMVHNDNNMFLIIGLTVAIGAVLYLLAYGVYVSLTMAVAGTIEFGLGLALLSVTRLPVSGITLFGVLTAVIFVMFAGLPVFSRYRELKRDAGIKHVDLNQRAELLDRSVKLSAPTLNLGYAAFALFSVLLVAFGGTQLLSMGLIMLILAAVGYVRTYICMYYNYLGLAKVIHIRDLRKPNLRRKPIQENKNEPHETIIPGIND